jgi:hypothetical protein
MERVNGTSRRWMDVITTNGECIKASRLPVRATVRSKPNPTRHRHLLGRDDACRVPDFGKDSETRILTQICGPPRERTIRHDDMPAKLHEGEVCHCDFTRLHRYANDLVVAKSEAGLCLTPFWIVTEYENPRLRYSLRDVLNSFPRVSGESLAARSIDSRAATDLHGERGRRSSYLSPAS